jgi:hypothetical protein
MRTAFLCVQLLDGFRSTRQDVAGELPTVIRSPGFTVERIDRLRTVTGTLELVSAAPTDGL